MVCGKPSAKTWRCESSSVFRVSHFSKGSNRKFTCGCPRSLLYNNRAHKNEKTIPNFNKVCFVARQIYEFFRHQRPTRASQRRRPIETFTSQKIKRTEIHSYVQEMSDLMNEILSSLDFNLTEWYKFQLVDLISWIINFDCRECRSEAQVFSVFFSRNADNEPDKIIIWPSLA